MTTWSRVCLGPAHPKFRSLAGQPQARVFHSRIPEWNTFLRDLDGLIMSAAQGTYKIAIKPWGSAASSESFPSQAMLFHVLFSSLLSLIGAAPQVKLGNATLIGRDVTLLNQDFFGGKTLPPVASLTPDMPDIPQGSLMQNLRSETYVCDIRS